MPFRQLDGDPADLFLTYSPDHPLSACIGLTEDAGRPLRLTFEGAAGANVLIVGRPRQAAVGICTSMLLDLARQIITTPERRTIYTTPPFHILDFSSTEESRLFSDAALSLPLAVKLERAGDTAMTTLTDLQYELARRSGRPGSPWHSKFLFLCGMQAAHGIRSRGFYAASGINPQASKFAEILRSGATHSVFAVVWCNSFANLDLTMADALDHFNHVILLPGAGRAPEAVFGPAPTEPGHHGRYIDRHRNTSVPFIPYGVPTESWCNAALRIFE